MNDESTATRLLAKIRGLDLADDEAELMRRLLRTAAESSAPEVEGFEFDARRFLASEAVAKLDFSGDFK